MGFHPYLGLGAPVEGLELHMPAQSHSPVPADPDERPAPVDVTGSHLDFRAPRTVGPEVLDTVFGDLARGDDGRAVVHLVDPAGARGVRLWVDDAFGYLMVYTADGVLPAERRRRAVAVEPMTCPPHAFRSGADLVTLGAGGVLERGVGAGGGMTTVDAVPARGPSSSTAPGSSRGWRSSRSPPRARSSSARRATT